MSDTESNPVAQVGKWIAQNNLPRILECFDWPEDPYHNRIQKLILERDPVTGRLHLIPMIKMNIYDSLISDL